MIKINSDIVAIRKARERIHPIKDTNTIFQIINYSRMGKLPKGKILIVKKIALNMEKDELMVLKRFFTLENEEIQIKEHKIIPNQKVIEIREGRNLIATIIPRITMISIVSKYIKNVEKDMDFPPKIILNLKERS